MDKRYAIFGSAAVGVILAAVAGAVSVGRAPSTLNYATCDAPVEEIVPNDWMSFPSEGPVLPVPLHVAGGDRQFDLVHEGKLFVDRHGDVIDLDTVDWATNNHNYVSTQLHALVGIGDLLESGEKLPDEIEARAAGHILNWAHCVSHAPGNNPRAWFEGTVVKRLSNLLHALNYIRLHDDLASLDKRTLLYLIDKHIDFLLDTPKVYSFGNHGIRQDGILAATALSLPEHPRAEEMLRLSETRLNRASRRLFTETGIWLEHAPGYVHYALRLMSDVIALHRVSDGDFNPELFIDRYDASRNFLMTVLLPNGRIPTVGQAGIKRPSDDIVPREELESHLAGKANTLTAFPDYGHAVLRGRHPNGLYLLFVAAQNLPAGKRQADDLSLILFNHNRVWITEAGHVDYEPGEIRDLTLSPMGHNTYVLNGKFLPANRRPELDVQLTRAEVGEDGFYLNGHSDRFPDNSTFERTIQVASDMSALTIRDNLSSPIVELWEGRFHFPGDLDVQLDGKTVVVTDSEIDHQMTVEFQSDAPLSFATCHGEKKPLCGWGQNFDGFGPITTLTWVTRENAEITIKISFQ